MKAVLFDLDGTLLDTARDIMSALNGALAENGLPPVTYGETVRYIGNGARTLIERATPASCDRDKVLASFAVRYTASENSETLPYAGMAELLGRLRARGMKLAVITNKLQASAEKVLEKFYPAAFDFVGGDSGMFPVKPDPSLARYCAMTLRVPFRDCAFVGDGETDVLTARSAGMVGVSTLWGYRSREVLEAAGARIFARDIGELEKILTDFS